jgi:hypothetical protein
LDRIVGMAGRQAATIARTLSQLPPTANARTTEVSLVRTAASAILSEMGSSSSTVGADADKPAAIVQGELDKVSKPPVVVAVAAPVSPVPRPA